MYAASGRDLKATSEAIKILRPNTVTPSGNLIVKWFNQYQS